MTVQELKETLTSAEASPAARERATALLSLYSASVGYALKDGGTDEYSRWSGDFNIWLYENDSIESIEQAENELLRLAA
jgi:hypothetical protein